LECSNALLDTIGMTYIALHKSRLRRSCRLTSLCRRLVRDDLACSSQRRLVQKFSQSGITHYLKQTPFYDIAFLGQNAYKYHLHNALLETNATSTISLFLVKTPTITTLSSTKAFVNCFVPDKINRIEICPLQ